MISYHDLRLLLNGMMLMMALYAGVSYWRYRQPMYATYTGYILLMGARLALRDWWAANPAWASVGQLAEDAAESLACVFYIRFAIVLQDYPRHDPPSYRMLRVMLLTLWGSVALELTLWLMQAPPYALTIAFALSRLVLIAGTVYIVPRILRLRLPVMAYFIVGTALFVAGGGVALSYLALPGWFMNDPANGFSFALIYQQIGVVLEILCFAMGISAKNQLVENEKQDTKNQLIEQLQENDRKQQRLLRIRDDIARDLHDELGSDLSAISVLATSATAALPRHPDRTTANLAQIGEMARNLLGTMREIVWSLNSAQGTYQNFGLKMRETAYLLFDGDTVKIHFDLPATRQPGSIPTEYRREILLIYKELLHNAHRHAHAQNLWISLTTTNDDADKNTLVLTVRDDGRGFDPATVPLNGNGIGFLHKRAETLGGQISWQSVAGQGTTARLSVEYAPVAVSVLVA